MYFKKCVICSKEFTTNRHNIKSCSSECRRLLRNSNVNERRKRRRIFYTKNCRRCNKEFITYWSRKVFCSHQCMQKYWDKFHADIKPRISNKRYSVANELRKTSFTPKQMSIVLGTLLGDGCLIKSSKATESTLYRLSWTHGAPQRGYIEWKDQEMKPFTTNGVIEYIRKNDNGFGRKDGGEVISYHLVTIGHDDLARVKGLLYRGNKKFVTRRYLNLLDELSLAVWYMDDGSYHKVNKNMLLYSYSMGISEHRTIKKWFWQKWRIECFIGKVNRKNANREKKTYYYLRFNRGDTNKFHNLIAPHIIPSMQYKLNPQRLIRLNA